MIGWEAEKNGSAFSCPQCKDQVILKKGKVYVHHFAHRPGSQCPNAGESMLHMNIKRSIFLALRGHRDCTQCAMERGLRGVRPDVSLRIRGKPVAIEIQVSSIDDTEINRRLLRYADKEIYCLWVTARDDIMPTPKAERAAGIQYFDANRGRIRTKKWERALHDLYGGRVYYWRSGAMVIPAHFSFGAYKRDVWPDFARGRGRGLKTSGKLSLHIARDFETGDAFIGRSRGVHVLIWKDGLADWWHLSAKDLWP